MTTSTRFTLRQYVAGLALLLAALGSVWLSPPAASAAGQTVVESFDAGLSDYQAGGHPEATVSFRLGRYDDGPLGGLPEAPSVLPPVGGAPKDVAVDLPKGLYGDPGAFPRCTTDQFSYGHCPVDSQVGAARLYLGATQTGPWGEGDAMPVFNMVPRRGEVALLGVFVRGGVNGFVSVKLRSDGDYGITATAANISDVQVLWGIDMTLWGVPYDPSHDPDRLCPDSYLDYGCGTTTPPVPFMVAPSECGVAATTGLKIRSWEHTGEDDWTSAESSPQQVNGCHRLDFSPTIRARPTTNVADSPSGLDVDLHIPQNRDPNGLAEAMLKDAVVTLPAGLTVNTASAAGLTACSPAEVGLTSPVGQSSAHFTAAPANCPAASKLGTVEVETPVLDHALPGSIYLASQNENPFGSLLALYIAIDDPQTGVVVKLPGKVEPDPRTGQLQASFEENPQLPFEDLRVSFFNGPRAALKTPLSCGSFTTTTNLTPWSSPEGANATPSDSFDLVQGANGSACLKTDAEAPNSPSFSAGTANPTAGAYSPFLLRVARADGTQPIKGIDTTLPKGLLGKLAGIPYCSDSALAAAAGKSGKVEQADSSCPPASQVGSVNVGAGAGPTPLHVSGKAYLAGAYRGAPLSLAIVTPAVAGPFDLGTVVVRTALNVNPETAQIHAVSDPIPTILQGIPLDVRSIALTMDRPDFTLNPTSCDPMSILGSATSIFDLSASLSSPFQVGGCGALGFKPKLSINLRGGTKRSDYPALRAVLKARPGDANIARAVVSLPHSEFLAQEHIRTICTRVQFAAGTCPKGSIYGKATAWSPLLDQPLSGPVYLRSSSNPLPDLVADLNGQIRVNLVGRIDSVNGGIRNTFDLVPDAPVSRFVLEMQGGKKGLLVNSRNLCAKGAGKATVKMDGHNGKAHDFKSPLGSSCGKKARKGKKGTRKGK